MTNKIRWFRCVSNLYGCTVGKLYPATEVDYQGDLAITNDLGKVEWVETREDPHDKLNTYKIISLFFEEVIPDD